MTCLVTLANTEGIKVLFVRLTVAGMVEIQNYCREAESMNVETRHYVINKIQASSTKFCLQIRFTPSSEPCIVKDLRNEDEVFDHLLHCVGLVNANGGN